MKMKHSSRRALRRRSLEIINLLVELNELVKLRRPSRTNIAAVVKSDEGRLDGSGRG